MKRRPWRALILSAITEKRSCTQEDLIAELGIPESTLSRWLTKLIDENVVRICSWVHVGNQKIRARYTTSPGRHAAVPPQRLVERVRKERYRRYHQRKREAAAAQKVTYVPLVQTLSIFMGGQLPADLAQEDGRGVQQPVHIDP